MKSTVLAHFVRLIATAWIAVVLVGCDENKMMRTGRTVNVVGTHQVTVEPGSPYVRSTTTGVGAGRVYEYTCAETRIIIRQDDLRVNRLSYGPLKPADEVLVSYGSVYVNGSKVEGRTPVEKRDPELSGYSVPESTTRLGGYTLRVRPGHNNKSRFHLQGAYVWRLGEQRFSVKDDEFFIDDVNYGKLLEGDSIMVEQGRVFISGRERLPYSSGEANSAAPERRTEGSAK